MTNVRNIFCTKIALTFILDQHFFYLYVFFISLDVIFDCGVNNMVSAPLAKLVERRYKNQEVTGLISSKIDSN